VVQQWILGKTDIIYNSNTEITIDKSYYKSLKSVKVQLSH